MATFQQQLDDAYERGRAAGCAETQAAATAAACAAAVTEARRASAAEARLAALNPSAEVIDRQAEAAAQRIAQS